MESLWQDLTSTCIEMSEGSTFHCVFCHVFWDSIFTGKLLEQACQPKCPAKPRLTRSAKTTNTMSVQVFDQVCDLVTPIRVLVAQTQNQRLACCTIPKPLMRIAVEAAGPRTYGPHFLCQASLCTMIVTLIAIQVWIRVCFSLEIDAVLPGQKHQKGAA